MNKLKIKKVGEWIHRIVGFTIFESLIVVVGFVGIYISMQVLGETNNLNFGTSMGLLQTTLAITYLQVANIFYWIMDINLFDFKKLWKKDGTKHKTYNIKPKMSSQQLNKSNILGRKKDGSDSSNDDHLETRNIAGEGN